MEIIDEREKRKLGELAFGDLFIDAEGDVCMVVCESNYFISDKNIDGVLFVSLKDGMIYDGAKCERVEKVTGKLYIED